MTGPPLVQCSVCGRRLRATTALPYSIRYGGRPSYFWYVRSHNAPDGQHCAGYASAPVGVLSADVVGCRQ